jgi:fluoroquinolone resistance protein
MEEAYIEDQLYSNQDFTATPLAKGEYEACRFEGCDFSETNFSGFKFSGCHFKDCNLSLVKTGNTAFRDCIFTGCKMLGVKFDDCNTIGLEMQFNHCNLQHSSFYKLKIKSTRFNESNLTETDFTQADLGNCNFDGCNLLYAIFDNTILEKADFRTAYNYSIDPENNRIKKAMFSLPGVAGLLNKYGISITP